MATPGKLKKKKKEVKFTAENIDNTAPVKKILVDLYNKNWQAFNFLSQNVRQRLTTKRHLQNFHFIVPGHPLNAFTEDWDGQLITNYFESFPYKSLNPKMITKLHHIKEIDPVTQIMSIKFNWKRDYRSLRITASCSKILNKYERLNEDVVYCPKHFVNMAMHLDSDPDPYFDSSYNWYYAGHGNLQYTCLNWSDYLLHSELSKLYLSHFNKNKLIISADPTATFDCGKGLNIMETICSSQNIVALRTKNKIFILRIQINDDEIKFEKVKEADSVTPYTSISFDGHHKHILYVTTLDNKLCIVNLERITGRSVKLKTQEPLSNNWNTVVSSDRNCYAHVSTKSVTLYDKKTNSIINQWRSLRNVTDEIKCNDISCALPTEGPYMYIATDHHVFLMDLRYNDKKSTRPVTRWTHGMQCVPTYITKCNFEFNKDLVCLSSQWCEDMCIFPNSYDTVSRDSDGISVTIPYRPPSILRVLETARKNLLCYDLFNPIDRRLRTAVTGSCIFQRDENFDILMQNSLGDVSCHTIIPDHLDTFMEDNSCQDLDEWRKPYKQEKEDFELSSIVNITDIWKGLKRVPPDYKVMEGKPEKSKFDEEEIINAYEKEEVDVGLLELWSNKAQDTVDQSAFSLNLHFSDSDEDEI